MDVSEKLHIPDHEFRLVLGRTQIEYDHEKEEHNCRKHGYSLQSAVALFERLLLQGNMPYAVSDSFSENGEIRHMHLSVDDTGRVVLMVTTMRPDETIRVISFRRANKKERMQFQELTEYVERT